MRLNFAPSAKPLALKAIHGGKDIKRRLIELGLVDGGRFEVVDSSGTGPVTIRLGGSKIAIGRGMAMHIEVEEIKEG